MWAVPEGIEEFFALLELRDPLARRCLQIGSVFRGHFDLKNK